MKRKAKRATAKPGKGSKQAARRGPAKGPSAAQAIRAMDQAFMQAAGARDAGTLVRGFYAPSAVLMPPNHPAVQGRAEIQKFLQGLMDAGLEAITLSTKHVEAAGDLACGRGTYTLTLAPAGGPRVEDAGKYIVVYRRGAGGTWQAVADIFNSDRPAAG
jgi:ketosteroid isomerase-like protein